mgnify:CR=1 FL=1
MREDANRARVQWKKFDPKTGNPEAHSSPLIYWLTDQLDCHLEERLNRLTKLVILITANELTHGNIHIEDVYDITDPKGTDFEVIN